MFAHIERKERSQFCHTFIFLLLILLITFSDFKHGSLYFQAKHCTIIGEIPQNHHTFALFDPPKNGSHLYNDPCQNLLKIPVFQRPILFKKSDSQLPGTNSTLSLENVNILAKPNSSKGVLCPKRWPMTNPGWVWGFWGKSTTTMEDPQRDGSETHKPQSDGATKKHWNTQKNILPALAWVVIVEHVQLQTCSIIWSFDHKFHFWWVILCQVHLQSQSAQEGGDQGPLQIPGEKKGYSAHEHIPSLHDIFTFGQMHVKF